jgi:hypothetical protein
MSKLVTRLQHASPERKYLMRRRLMRWLRGIDGAAYVPFCGHLDIALGWLPGAKRDEAYNFPGIYGDRVVFACDLDEDRVRVAQERLSDGLVRCGDANEWLFGDVDTGPLAVIDCDAWDQPWGAFRAAWEHCEKAPRVAVFWTTAGPMGSMVDGVLVRPDGSKHTITSLPERRRLFFQYAQRVIWPWLVPYVAADGFRVVDRVFYRRGMVDYGGVVLEREDSGLKGMIGRRP